MGASSDGASMPRRTDEPEISMTVIVTSSSDHAS